MINVLLAIHLVIALALIGLVMMQKSEGGALGIGGGGGNLFSSRGVGSALTRATAILAAAFFVTSILLTVLAGKPAGSIVNQLPQDVQSAPAEGTVAKGTTAPSGGDAGSAVLPQLNTGNAPAPAAPAAPVAPAQ